MKQFPTHIVTVDGFIENDQGEILLEKSRHHQAYTIPGGQVEAGENLIDALKRETMEETGAQIEVARLVCIRSNTGTYPGYNGYGMVPTKVMFTFAGRYTGGELRISDETSEVLWVKKDEVLQYVTFPTVVESFQAYREERSDILYLAGTTKPQYDMNFRRYL